MLYENKLLVREVQRNMSTAESNVKRDFTEQMKDPNFEFKKDSACLYRLVYEK